MIKNPDTIINVLGDRVESLEQAYESLERQKTESIPIASIKNGFSLVPKSKAWEYFEAFNNVLAGDSVWSKCAPVIRDRITQDERYMLNVSIQNNNGSISNIEGSNIKILPSDRSTNTLV